MKTASHLPRQNETETTQVTQDLSDDQLKALIRKMNLKVTGQRLLILHAFHEGRRHMTAQELFEKVVKRDSSIGFATVYRFLRSMADQKLVTEVRMGGLPARYELTPQKHHDHLTCTECGQIVEFENKTIESLQEKVAQQFGFQLTDHLLELYGVCSKCPLAQHSKSRLRN
ncbi:MAG: Fur family transcriptional regulator [Bdellovibrionales bacterium]